MRTIDNRENYRIIENRRPSGFAVQSAHLFLFTILYLLSLIGDSKVICNIGADFGLIT